MWLGGHWLATQRDDYSTLAYAAVSITSTTLAFIISTQTYYLFSGRFPASGVVESMQHGWEYLPSYLGFTMMYFAIVWLVVRVLRRLNVTRSATA